MNDRYDGGVGMVCIGSTVRVLRAVNSCIAEIPACIWDGGTLNHIRIITTRLHMNMSVRISSGSCNMAFRVEMQVAQRVGGRHVNPMCPAAKKPSRE
jgi:hypothetical protein